jgi:molybdate transport system substrate-binding protein
MYSRAFKTTTLAFLFCLGAASGEEIKVMTSGAFTAAYRELIPQFERATANKVVTSYGASMGNAPDSIPMRLERGEAADIVILARPALDELVNQGKVLSGSRVDLVRSSIGMAVRAGARKPDISTVEALKHTLLEAKSIAVSDSASGVYLSTDLFPRLGIAGKSKRIASEPVGAVVARGDAEIGFQQISELLPVPGIDYVGPLPPEVQKVTVFSAGVATGSRAPDAARALIQFLASPSAIPTIVKSGLEPVTAHGPTGNSTLTIPPVKASIKLDQQAIDITLWGSASPTPSAAFALALTIDLGDFQEHLTPVLSAQLNRTDHCGDRLVVERAAITPSAPGSLLTANVNFERFGCVKAFGKQISKRLVGGHAVIEVNLMPEVEGNDISITAEVRKIDADGSLGEVLRSDSVGDSIRDKIAESVESAIRKLTDLKSTLPAAMGKAVTIQSVQFADGGAGRLYLTIAADVRLPADQLLRAVGQ